MRQLKQYTLFCFILLLFITDKAVADPLFLNMPLESRGLATGNTMTARARNSQAIRYNPAGLGFSTGSEITASHILLNDYFSGDSFTYSYAFAPFFSVGLFASTVYLNDSFARVKDFETQNNSLNLVDFEVGVSGGYEILPHFAVGSNLRYFRLQLGPQVAQSFGADVGVQYRFNMPWMNPQTYRKFALGVTVNNIGPPFDFYGGGEKELQPLEVRTGFSYEPVYYLITSIEHGYSIYEDHSYHFGVELFPEYYISPKAGVTYSFDGLTFSAGGGISYGEGVNFSLLAGTEMGDRITGNQLFFSAVMKSNSFPDRYRPRSDFSMPDQQKVAEVDINYRPYRLVPFVSGFEAEKVQGIIISTEEANGYLEVNSRLRRVALQPEDEDYLKEMNRESRQELYLTGRRMGVWMHIEKMQTGRALGYWELFSARLDESGKTETLLGSDLNKLNSNPNAPLRVEWRIRVKIIESDDRTEIRTELYELYSGDLMVAKNATYYSKDGMLEAWGSLADFYANWFNSIESFYHLRLVQK